MALTIRKSASNKARIESAENGYVVWLSKRINEKDEVANRYVFVTLTEAIDAIHSFMDLSQSFPPL